MKKNIRSLHTLADYEWAIKEIETYFKNIPFPRTKAADRFDALSLLIENFEDIHFPVPRNSGRPSTGAKRTSRS